MKQNTIFILVAAVLSAFGLISCTNSKTNTNPTDTTKPKTISKGNIITFGHYEQDNNTTNGKEPIAWRILDINTTGQYLIISEKSSTFIPTIQTRFPSRGKKALFARG